MKSIGNEQAIRRKRTAARRLIELRQESLRRLDASGFVLSRDMTPEALAALGLVKDAPFEAVVAEDPSPSPFFVYEPSDLDEFNLGEVARIWEGRAELCGSLEVAAEAMAVLRAASGSDDRYRSWRAPPRLLSA